MWLCGCAAWLAGVHPVHVGCKASLKTGEKSDQEESETCIASSSSTSCLYCPIIASMELSYFTRPKTQSFRPPLPAAFAPAPPEAPAAPAAPQEDDNPPQKKTKTLHRIRRHVLFISCLKGIQQLGTAMQRVLAQSCAIISITHAPLAPCASRKRQLRALGPHLACSSPPHKNDHFRIAGLCEASCRGTCVVLGC